ncbi:MAG: crtI [Segetibacter sp.]|nr:crtI [Segetibacter sp.]
MPSKKIIVIGSGFAGLSAACCLAKEGFNVTVVEQHALPGGRARKFEAEGFTFDMGPSWYWMPDVFERFFQLFNKRVEDYYKLKRLDPSYRVYWSDGPVNIPAGYKALKALFESIEKGSGNQLDLFLAEAKFKYDVGMKKLVFKPGLSAVEFIDAELMKGLFKLDVFSPMKKHIAKYFKSKKLQELMEFPVLFLGALPEDTPALYSLMNYADIKGGTWFPEGGMYSVVDGMYKLALQLGVTFQFNQKVIKIIVNDGTAEEVITDKGTFQADVVVGAADYHFIETKLLDKQYQSYNQKYWESREMAPSCLLYYIGLNKKLHDVLHHSLFFDSPFLLHGEEIYKTKKWPSDPLFYVSATSVTDTSLAPEGCENLFFLVPVAPGLKDDSEELREAYFQKIVTRMEALTGEKIKDHIVYKRTFAGSDFVSEYNSFKGNAYGLANTLLQTAILKPSIKSKKVKNLYYTGQLTVPGPGVPPSLISGEIVAKEVAKRFGKVKEVN